MRMLRLRKQHNNGRATFVAVRGDEDESSYASIENLNDPTPPERYWSKIGWSLHKLLDHYKQEGWSIVKKEINNDVDWLNAVQCNFKDGV